MFTGADTLADTAIILVMFRQKHNLELLYSSLQTQSCRDFKIYFVDNNPDNSDTAFSKELNTKYGLDIEYISANRNTGFACGNNIGAETAIKQGAQFVFFLNNDTILNDNCIEELTGYLKTNPGTAAVSPLIFYWEGKKEPGKIQEFGADADFNSYNIKKYFEGADYNSVKNDIPETKFVNTLPGAAMMVRSSALDKTGLWEESYFAYGDEIDLARRLSDAGYNCAVLKNAALWHNHKWVKENKEGYCFEYYLIQRNKYLYFRKFGLYGNMLMSYLTDSLKFPFRLLWFAKVSSLKTGYYYIKGTYAGLLNHKGKPKLSFLK